MRHGENPEEKIQVRLSKDDYWLMIVLGIKLRATCPRRQGGAVIVDEDNYLLSSGYNGAPIGIRNCIDFPCDGVNDVSGNTDRCIAAHAEHNAVMQLGDRKERAKIMYCTTKPCFKCAITICGTPIKKVIYLEDYPDIRGENIFYEKGIMLYKGSVNAQVIKQYIEELEHVYKFN